jgi:hypothetical protein
MLNGDDSLIKKRKLCRNEVLYTNSCLETYNMEKQGCKEKKEEIKKDNFK